MSEVHESSIIERLQLSPDSAEAILSLHFPPQDEERMRELMDKNNRGTIGEEEREEMESYRRLGNLLSILQARARLHLRKG